MSMEKVPLVTQNAATSKNTQFPTANKIKNPLQQPFTALKI